MPALAIPVIISFNNHSINNLDELNSSHLEVADPGSSDSPSLPPTDPVYRCLRHGPTYVYIHSNDFATFDSVTSTNQYPCINPASYSNPLSPIRESPRPDRSTISLKLIAYQFYYLSIPCVPPNSYQSVSTCSEYQRSPHKTIVLSIADPTYTTPPSSYSNPLWPVRESPRPVRSTISLKLIAYQIYCLSVPCVPSYSYQSVSTCSEYQRSPHKTIVLSLVDPNYTTPLSSNAPDSSSRFCPSLSRTIYYHFTLIPTQQCQSRFRVLLPDPHPVHPTEQHDSITQSSLLSLTLLQPISMTTLIPTPVRPHKICNMTQNHIAQQYISPDQRSLPMTSSASRLNTTQLTFHFISLDQRFLLSTTSIFKPFSLWNISRPQPGKLLIPDNKTKTKAIKTKSKIFKYSTPFSYSFFSMLTYSSRPLLTSSLVRGPLT